MISCRCCGSTQPLGVLYCPCALNSSTKSSSTVGPTFVNPQPMRWLWPTTTKGTPGSVTPATSKSPLCVLRWASNQRFGISWSRCISFESSGFPVVVCCPETTQLFEPGRNGSASCSLVIMADDGAVADGYTEVILVAPPCGSTSSSSSSSSSPSTAGS